MFTVRVPKSRQPDVKKEKERYKSQTARILELLKQYPSGQVTNGDLVMIAHNYTMRISELRKEGHVIQAEYLRPGVWRYFYKGTDDSDEVADTY